MLGTEQRVSALRRPRLNPLGAAALIAAAILAGLLLAPRAAPSRLVANSTGSFWRLNVASGAVELCGGQVASNKPIFFCTRVLP